MAAPNAERDFLFDAIEGEDINVHLRAGLEDFAGTRNPTPGELGNVGETVGATEVDEGAKAGQVADPTLANLTDLEFVEKLLAAFGAQFSFGGALGEDQAVATPVHLDDLEFQGLVDELGEPRGDVFPTLVRSGGSKADELGHGHESARTDVDEDATLVELGDPGFDDLAFVVQALGLAPELLLHGPPDGEHGGAFAFWLDDVNGDGFPDFKLGAAVHEVGIEEFAADDDAFRLQADIEHYLFDLDPHDYAIDDLTAPKHVDFVVAGIEEVVHGFQLGIVVVGGNSLDLIGDFAFGHEVTDSFVNSGREGALYLHGVAVSIFKVRVRANRPRRGRWLRSSECARRRRPGRGEGRRSCRQRPGRCRS